MQCYHLQIQESGEGEGATSRVGGRPEVPAGYAWPSCATCGEKMAFLLQLAVPAEMGGGKLALFTCLQHCDPVMPPASPQLKPNYWSGNDEYTQYFLSLHSGEGVQLEPESRTQCLAIELLPTEESLHPEAAWPSGSRGFKLGGTPSWCQEPEEYRCSCGAEMKPLLQIPEYQLFPKQPAAPPQENSISDKGYMPFLGNEIYVLACAARCHPQALWPVAQN